ncbi:MAG: hypothetical protein E7319_08435 [Clostridiales bacterium]|nr:hypothetical protein [Clostridiales bacterium]
MQQPYSMDMIIEMSMVDMMGKWQPGSVFRTLQVASGAHAGGWGLGREDLARHGIAWVLTRAAYQMDEYPVYGQTITVKTWPGKARHGFFPRHYTFELNGREIGRATGLYVIMDIQQRKMADPARLPGELPEYDIPAPMPAPGAIALPDAEPVACVHQVKYSDLDFNLHVNNTRYIDWYADCFDWKYHQQHELSEVTVHYLQEIRPGECVDLLMRKAENVAVLQGSADGQQRFQIKGVWRACSEGK